MVGKPTRKVAKVLIELVGFPFVVVVLFSVVFSAFFFATPELTIPLPKLRWLLTTFLPGELAVDYDNLRLTLRRPEGLPFAKQVNFSSGGLCVRYRGEAINACIGKASLAATLGWGGERAEGDGKWVPRIISIEPIELLKSDVSIELAKFPKAKGSSSSFSVVDFVRTHILPKWKVEGSRVELRTVSVVTEDGDRIDARGSLTTIEDASGKAQGVRVALEKLTESAHRLKSELAIDVLRSSGARGADIKAVGFAGWSSSDGKPSRVDLNLKINAANWRDAKLALSAKFKGLSGLREARLDGQLAQPKFTGTISVKLGASGSRIKALDFVNCGLTADLDRKLGGLSCGPETIRLVLYQRGPIMNQKLFVLTPRLELELSKILFGAEKAADFHAKLDVDHLGLVRERSELNGHVVLPPGKNFEYQVEGGISLAIASWERIVKMLSETPYSVPAPLNELAGKLTLDTKLKLSQDGGSVGFKVATALDSSTQAVHLRLEGSTNLAKQGDKLVPATEATLFIDRLNVSAPRFDLRVPPRLNLDSRFGSLTPAPPPSASAAKLTAAVKVAQASAPMNLRLKIVTTTPQAIHVATNLTKGDIPVDLDLVYQEKAAEEVVLGRLVSGSPAKIPKAIPVVSTKPPSVTGTVVIGQTPIEIFRRNATLKALTINLLPNGLARVNGSAQVVYLDYAISILLSGSTAEPQLKFASDPPLDDDQILAVLLFGRPLNELGADQASSVGNLKSAFADAALGLSSLYLLANTPIESVGYDPDRELVTAKVGIGGGASLELGAGSDASAVGIKKKLSRDFSFRSDVETLGTSGKKTVSALIEWVKRF